MTEPDARSIATTTHGRYLVRRPAGDPVGVIIGFHGYAENADILLEALQTIESAQRWLLVSVQALHPFYTRDQRVVANWMTRQDRELAIADNLEYVRRVREAIASEYGVPSAVVYAGFSQGAAMAYRAAADDGADGLIILAGDVPPDVGARPMLRLPPVLLGRGTSDNWYTKDKQDADREVLARRGVDVESCVFDGGHEWSAAFRGAASAYLQRLA